MSVGFAALAKRAATSQSPARVTPRSPGSASEKKAGSQREVGQVRKPPLAARLSLSCRVPRVRPDRDHIGAWHGTGTRFPTGCPSETDPRSARRAGGGGDKAFTSILSTTRLRPPRSPYRGSWTEVRCGGGDGD